jgi:antitoxin component HigA of HigAB toxin-antitoxin module
MEKTTMKTTQSPSEKLACFEQMPRDYGVLCRDVWLPRPIRTKAEKKAAMSAINPFWGRESAMTPDQTDWFELVANLIHEFEEKSEPAPSEAMPVTSRLAGLLEANALTAASLARLLGLEPSMGSKILSGARRLTVEHIKILSRHFHLPSDYFLGN